jgi:excisionase family DNA binding protein
MSVNERATPAPVDINTAARLLGVHTKFIRRRIAAGHLKAYRLKGSRVIRIDRGDLEKLKEPVQPSGDRR